jgi:hypothetical protein
MPGGIDARVHVHEAFVGMHAASDRELSMSSLQARMVNLAEWLGISGLDVTTFQSKPRTLKYSQPNEVGLSRSGGALMVASFEPVGEATPANGPVTLTFEQRAWFVVRVNRRRTFDDLNALVGRFIGFLSFAAGLDSPVLELSGTARVPIKEFGTGRVIYQTRRIWVLYHRQALPTNPRPAKRMLFRYGDIKARKLLPLTRWHRRSVQLEPVRNLYLSALPSRPLHIEFRFLAFAQALEAYHFRKHPTHMYLKTRLDSLVDQLPAAIKQHVPNNFTTLAKDTRNYFTHWTPKLEAKAAHGDQLVALTFAVKLLFELTMLLELGFAKKQIADWVTSENQRLVWDMQASFLSL